MKISKELLKGSTTLLVLNLLKEEHKFVIEKHLIQHYVWKETLELFEEKWGVMNSRSERTLKRMQSEGLEKILEFIKTSKLESYFQESCE